MDTDTLCRHCGRAIVWNGTPYYGWIAPDATGDDAIWRDTCDSHDTFIAEHEPTEGESVMPDDYQRRMRAKADRDALDRIAEILGDPDLSAADVYQEVDIVVRTTGRNTDWPESES